MDRGGFFARTYPSRSYGIAVRLESTAPTDMYVSADGLPFIGRLPLSPGRVLVVTGLNRWGLAMGAAAALILDEYRSRGVANLHAPGLLRPVEYGEEELGLSLSRLSFRSAWQRAAGPGDQAVENTRCF